MLKHGFTLSLRPDILHFAAHSQHPLPDVTRDAQLRAWDDAARLLDEKWRHVFDVVVPHAQRSIAGILELSHPEMIAFAPNASEFVSRILSCFPADKPLRILTTTSEHVSFSRPLARIAERPNVMVKRVPADPCDGFTWRLRKALAEARYDLVFFSQVFFDSGFRIEDLGDVVSACTDTDTVIVIDGYHGFCAVPTSLKSIQDRVYYIAGGYKYAQSGEGVCFMTVPYDSTLRPENTGWFTEFGAFEEAKENEVSYPSDGFRFWGATFDPSGLYRFNAVMDWFRSEGVSVPDIFGHASKLQRLFITLVEEKRTRVFHRDHLKTPRGPRRGNFLTYDCVNATIANRYQNELRSQGVIVDTRRHLMRIGFGVYHDEADVEELVQHLSRLKSTFT